jgi:hypothetical protein
MSFSVNLGNLKIHNDQTINIIEAKQPPHISINIPEDQLSTLIIYDLSAPNVNNPVNSPFIHFLEVNIPGSQINKGEVYISYTPPNPPSDSGIHTYIVDLFRQNNILYPNISDKRETFPLTQFVQSNNLVHVNRLIFKVSQSHKSHSHGMWTEGLDEADDKFCSYVVEVGARQGGAYNPYAVCHSSIKGESGRPSCSEHYIFENIPDNELMGYADLHKIPIPQPYNRQQLIQTIYNKLGE